MKETRGAPTREVAQSRRPMAAGRRGPAVAAGRDTEFSDVQGGF